MADALILQAARFGDLVQTRRLIKSLEGEYTVHICADAALADLAEILYPGTEIHSLFIHEKADADKIKRNMKTLAELRAINFKHIYNCNFSPITAAVCRLFDDSLITGYRPHRQEAGGVERSPWVRFAFRLAAKRTINSLNLEDFWGYFCADPVEPEAVNPAPKPLGEAVGVAIAGRDARRSLSPQALKNIIVCLNRIYKGPEFILLGSEGERAAAKKLIRELAGEKLRLKDLTGRTNWRELKDAFFSLRLLIAPDTGLGHLAAFLGVPVMSFFLSSAWAHETAPYGAGHIIWQSAPDCAPCLENAPCSHETKCAAVFQGPEFARIFSQFLLNPEKSLEFPPGLQLWRSGFDNAGQTLELIRGLDPYQRGRKAARDYIQRFLRLEAAPFLDYPNEWVETCGKLLCPDEEWMLPPERYC